MRPGSLLTSAPYKSFASVLTYLLELCASKHLFLLQLLYILNTKRFKKKLPWSRIFTAAVLFEPVFFFNPAMFDLARFTCTTPLPHFSVDLILPERETVVSTVSCTLASVAG